MNSIFSPYSVSISELKKNPSRLLEDSGGEAVTILNHNRPTAYLVPAEVYEGMLERLEDAELMEIAEARAGEKNRSVEVSLDDL